MSPAAKAADESGHESSHCLIYKLKLVKKRLFSYQLASFMVLKRFFRLYQYQTFFSPLLLIIMVLKGTFTKGLSGK